METEPNKEAKPVAPVEAKVVPPAEEHDDEPAPEGIVRDGEISTVTLMKPIEHGTQTYEVVSLREATAGDLIRSDKAKGDAERGCILISVITGLPMTVVKKLKARDLERLMEEIDYLKNA